VWTDVGQGGFDPRTSKKPVIITRVKLDAQLNIIGERDANGCRVITMSI
jgi:hypothetical protein